MICECLRICVCVSLCIFGAQLIKSYVWVLSVCSQKLLCWPCRWERYVEQPEPDCPI